MSKFCILLSVVILVSGFCFFLSHANIVRQSKGQSRVTQKSRRLQTTTQSDYFFDGSGYGESGLDPNFGDTEGGDDDDDDDYLGSGLDFKTPHVEHSSTVPPLVSSTTMQQTTFSTLTQVTVDVEPTESPVTLEAAIPKEVVKEHQAVPSANTTESPANTTDVMSDPRLSTPHFALNLTTSEASSSSSSPSTVPSTTTTTSTTTSTTALPTTITTATKITTVVTTTTARATTSTFPPVPTSRTSHRPARRTTTTTTRKPATRTTTSFKDDDLDGGDDDDAITDLDNNLHPTPGKDADVGVSIDKQEEDTNEVLSNLPVMYRVSNLPKLAFLSQSGVLAGIIAGSIVVLLCLVLLIMFVVYHLKRKSEPAFDRSTRSPVKAGYKKALDKDIYG